MPVPLRIKEEKPLDELGYHLLQLIEGLRSLHQLLCMHFLSQLTFVLLFQKAAHVRTRSGQLGMWIYFSTWIEPCTHNELLILLFELPLPLCNVLYVCLKVCYTLRQLASLGCHICIITRNVLWLHTLGGCMWACVCL